MAAERLRVVLDSNVLLRLVLTKKPDGFAGALRELLWLPAFELVISEALLAELRHPTMVRRHGLEQDEIEAFVTGVRTLATVTPGTRAVSLPALEARDPDDMALVVAALEGKADAVVTQDADLLDLEPFEDIAFIDPLTFLQWLRRGPAENA